MKRFYKTASHDAVEGGFAIRLDARSVKTPAKVALIVPTLALADAIVGEWEAQGDKVDPRSMPFTGLANAAIDQVTPIREAFAADLGLYAETDLLCYRAADPPPLVERQAASWDPLLAWARARYDIGFEIVTGIIHKAQPAATIQRLADAVAARDAFRLSALSHIVTITGSLVTSFALIEGAVDVKTAFDATHLDEIWQAEMWGEDWMATDMRDARRRDFEAAARFISLLD